MGLQIQIDEAITDTSIPILYPHPLMDAGTILCVDFPYEGLSTVPLSGVEVNNYASQQLGTMAGVSTGLNPTFNISNPVIATEMVLGFASNGAFQGIYTKSADTGATAVASLDVPMAVKNYLLANPTHQYYVCDIVKKLYDWHNASSADMLIGSSATYGSNQLCHAGTADYGYVIFGTGRNLGTNQTTTNGILKRDCGVNGALGNLNNSTLFRGYWKACGGVGPYGGSEVNKGVSNALFNWLISDMTVSGLTYAQCAAKTNAYFAIETAPGGRFYNGTYLDPATLP